jgi:5-methylcytosine-specific restriction enzyme subunit McrC
MHSRYNPTTNILAIETSYDEAYRALSGMVKITRMDACHCIKHLYHRLNEDYRPMHGLYRFFLEHCGPGMKAGEHEFITFVLNMPALFESFVAEWLRANIPGNMHLTPQYQASLDQSGIFRFELTLSSGISVRIIVM